MTPYSLRSTGAVTIATARPGEADVIIDRPDRPRLHRRPEPESANNNPLL